MTARTESLDRQVSAELDEILDPCSTFTERPQSIVQLGLVDGVAIDGGDVTVHLLPTNQLCMYIPHMTEEIERRVGSLPGVASVCVEIVADEVWTRDRMTKEAGQERADYFLSRIEKHGLTPAYDGESWSESIASKLQEGTDG